MTPYTKPYTTNIKSFISKYKSNISKGLLCIFLSYFIGITFFTHVHYVDGVRIVHSHPFAFYNQDSPNNLKSDHTHSTEQIRTIQHLDYILFIVASSLVLRKATELVFRIKPYNISAIASIKAKRTFLRGPPEFL